MTAGNTLALTIQTFIGKVMSLLFNVLSRFVIAFFPRSKCLLISCLQSPSEILQYCFFRERERQRDRGKDGRSALELLVVLAKVAR